MDISSSASLSQRSDLFAAPASSDAPAERKAAGQDADPADAEKLRALQESDAAVRRHEQAHLAAAAGLARSGASFTYQRGPDGKLYATGGEVSIDVSAAATPSATIAKAQQIRAAALAPANPSAQDRAVAAEASRMEAEARMELAQQRQALAEEQSGAEQGKGAAAVGAYQRLQDQTEAPLTQLIAAA